LGRESRPRAHDPVSRGPSPESTLLRLCPCRVPRTMRPCSRKSRSEAGGHRCTACTSAPPNLPQDYRPSHARRSARSTPPRKRASTSQNRYTLPSCCAPTRGLAYTPQPPYRPVKILPSSHGLRAWHEERPAESGSYPHDVKSAPHTPTRCPISAQRRQPEDCGQTTCAPPALAQRLVHTCGRGGAKYRRRRGRPFTCISTALHVCAQEKGYVRGMLLSAVVVVVACMSKPRAVMWSCDGRRGERAVRATSRARES
jgi:hypothetical protein